MVFLSCFHISSLVDGRMCFILTEYSEVIGLLDSVMNCREGMQEVCAAKACEEGDKEFSSSIFLIIFIYCNWVVTRWHGYFTCKQNMKLVTTKFKSGGLHEKQVVATGNFGNHLSICF